jgi:hypothetical protein
MLHRHHSLQCIVSVVVVIINVVVVVISVIIVIKLTAIPHVCSHLAIQRMCLGDVAIIQNTCGRAKASRKIEPASAHSVASVTYSV